MGKQHKFSTFNYRIIRRNRKTVGIKVTEEGEVIIASPFGVSKKIICDIIRDKEEWISRKIALMKQASILEKREMKNGSKFWFLGKELELEIIKTNKVIQSSKIENERIIVFVSSDDVVKDKIMNLYKGEARKVLNERTDVYSKVIGVNPNKIFIKDQKTLWGSCSSRKNINYNYRIIMAPIEIVDYIVVHELCHLIHMNHSKSYWNTVQSILPDYEERRKWLKSNGYMLKI